MRQRAADRRPLLPRVRQRRRCPDPRRAVSISSIQIHRGGCADGRPVPEEVARLLAALIVDSAETGEVLDIYAAAGMPQYPALQLG